MNEVLSPTIIIFGILGAAIAGGTVFYFLKSSKKRSVLKKSLHFALFEVSLPKTQKEQGQILKDLIAGMEQFYAGVSIMKPHIAFEIASPSTENQTNFYVAVPRNQASVFEKQVNSIFPNAEIREEKKDYNIFQFSGYNAGVSMNLNLHDALPVKTYEDLTVDPLEVLANTFSTFNKETEGAAMQIVVVPDDKGFNKKANKAIESIRSGVSLKDALQGEGALETTKRLIKGPADIKDKGGAGGGQYVTAQQEEIINLLKAKVSKSIFQTNIRLVASAETKERTKEILEQMKNVFAQFAESQGNSFGAKYFKGKRLKTFFFNFSFRLFDERERVYLNLAELTSIFHFPAFQIAAPKVKFLRVKKTTPPDNLPSGGLLLGNNKARNIETPVFMNLDDRRRHFYTIGQTGTGKTAFMKNLIVQDIRQGHGLCFIDPHGDEVEDILGQIPSQRWDDVIYFSPGDVARPLGLNMLEYDPKYPEQKSLIVNELMEIFNKLYDMKTAGGPMFEQYFRNAALLTMDDPDSGNTLLEITRVLTDPEFRNMKISKSKNEVVKNFWKEIAEKAGGEQSLQNIVPYVSSKFDTFLTNDIMKPIVCQQKSAFNFRDILDSGKIFLVNLSKGRLGEANAYLLGMILISRLSMAAMSRTDIFEHERKDFFFYIDEFQNVTTRTIASILSEARKYRLSLTVAHQFIGQLDEEVRKAVFGNVGSMAIFRVGTEDAEFLASHFEPIFKQEDLISLPNYNAYLKLLINGETSPPFNMETIAPEKGNDETKEKVRELSSVKYGRPRSQIEDEINKRYFKSIKKD